MRAIVTGATGMIGWNLTEYLVSKGIDVIAVINPMSKRKNNITALHNVTVIECDIERLNELLVKERCDIFFHLAWIGTHGKARDDMNLQERNVKTSLYAVDLAYRAGCKIFVGAGSQAEYGPYYTEKLSGGHEAKPVSCYGIGKLAAGLMTRKRCEQLGMKHVWARIFSVYGPGDGDHTMVMSGIYAMLNGESPAYTPAEQDWDYLYVKDAVAALYLMALEGVDGKTYCIGSGKTRKLKEYIKDIRDIIDPSIEARIGELPYQDKQVMYLCADIDELVNDTGFAVETSFRDGIKETVRWAKEKMSYEKN